ncbi:MAG TPA: DUF294 nucleotidyltransferase-like domain-containing protein, partial [Opitutus sp.]|nr:DUF294 nucleotidyltransferase-like domain-containing protein [Opitutus sp.]
MSVTPTVLPVDPLAFPDNASSAERLAACKAYLQAHGAELRARHAAGISGLEIAHERSATIDRMLIRLFDHAYALYVRDQGKPPAPVALVALGGYGRGELSPFSDVDLMFLFPAKTKPAAIKSFLEHLTNEILYPLWD